jgi:hypothetical protein
MKRIFLLTTLIVLTILSISSQNTNVEQINADSLTNNIDKYSNKNIEIEGIIVHICGVDGKKMKLKTKGGEIIKIVPSDSTSRFDKVYNQKTVIIQGKITESKLKKLLIDSLGKEKTLLCHIDNSPCKDKEWVENKKSSGVADSLSEKDTERLRVKMLRTGKDYVSVFTMIADKVIIKEGEKIP